MAHLKDLEAMFVVVEIQMCKVFALQTPNRKEVIPPAFLTCNQSVTQVSPNVIVFVLRRPSC